MVAISWLARLGDGAEAHQRMVGAAVRLAPDVGDGKAQIDEVVVGERKRCFVERLQQRAGDEMRLSVSALARPGMQRELVLRPDLAAGREVRNARFAERHVRE